MGRADQQPVLHRILSWGHEDDLVLLEHVASLGTSAWQTASRSLSVPPEVSAVRWCTLSLAQPERTPWRNEELALLAQAYIHARPLRQDGKLSATAFYKAMSQFLPGRSLSAVRQVVNVKLVQQSGLDAVQLSPADVLTDEAWQELLRPWLSSPEAQTPDEEAKQLAKSLLAKHNTAQAGSQQLAAGVVVPAAAGLTEATGSRHSSPAPALSACGQQLSQQPAAPMHRVHCDESDRDLQQGFGPLSATSFMSEPLPGVTADSHRLFAQGVVLGAYTGAGPSAAYAGSTGAARKRKLDPTNPSSIAAALLDPGVRTRDSSWLVDLAAAAAAAAEAPPSQGPKHQGHILDQSHMQQQQQQLYDGQGLHAAAAAGGSAAGLGSLAGAWERMQQHASINTSLMAPQLQQQQQQVLLRQDPRRQLAVPSPAVAATGLRHAAGAPSLAWLEATGAQHDRPASEAAEGGNQGASLSLQAPSESAACFRGQPAAAGQQADVAVAAGAGAGCLPAPTTTPAWGAAAATGSSSALAAAGSSSCLLPDQHRRQGINGSSEPLHKPQAAASVACAGDAIERRLQQLVPLADQAKDKDQSGGNAEVSFGQQLWPDDSVELSEPLSLAALPRLPSVTSAALLSASLQPAAQQQADQGQQQERPAAAEPTAADAHSSQLPDGSSTDQHASTTGFLGLGEGQGSAGGAAGRAPRSTAHLWQQLQHLQQGLQLPAPHTTGLPHPRLQPQRQPQQLPQQLMVPEQQSGYLQSLDQYTAYGAGRSVLQSLPVPADHHHHQVPNLPSSFHADCLPSAHGSEAFAAAAAAAAITSRAVLQAQPQHAAWPLRQQASAVGDPTGSMSMQAHLPVSAASAAEGTEQQSHVNLRAVEDMEDSLAALQDMICSLHRFASTVSRNRLQDTADTQRFIQARLEVLQRQLQQLMEEASMRQLLPLGRQHSR